MPYGDNDWLALTTEETLEPELPICDAHHHFWDYRTDRVPYHRYLLHELAADVNSGHNVRSTVFLEARAMYRQTGPEELRPVGEVEFVQGLAAASASGLYGPGQAAAAIVGHANLNLGDDVARVLDALQAASPNRSGASGTTPVGTRIRRWRAAASTGSWPATTSAPGRRFWRVGAWLTTMWCTSRSLASWRILPRLYPT